ncbi:MAG: DUF917 domain-containing protein, partial [Bifidobacteriaceae bacterium]|nr:DUF917 domain-containing protein [Bifidobacteriaceae bacterium]
MWTLQLRDLDELSLGSRLLGAGGGGDILAARLVLHQALEDHGPAEVAGLDELPDDAQVAAVAVIGTPTVLTEKVPGVDQLLGVIAALERRLGRPLDAV